MNKQLRKELRTNLATNPFNDKFDASALAAVIREKSPEFSFIIPLFEAFNECFKAHYDTLKDWLRLAGYGKPELVKALLGMANRHYIQVLQDVKRRNKIGDMGRLFSEKTELAGGDFGIDNAAEVSEAVIDTVAMLVDFVNKFEYEAVNDFNQKIPGNFLRGLFQSQSYLELIKNAYETPVWRNATYKLRNGQYFIDLECPSDFRCFEIARYRMEQKVMSRYLHVKSEIDAQKIGAVNFYPVSQKGKAVAIEGFRFTDGFIQCNLVTSPRLPVPDHYLEFLCAIDIYYPFLLDLLIPGSGGLKIYDLLFLYSLFQEIFGKLTGIETKSDHSSTRSQDQLYDQIKMDELEYYFLKRTSYSLQQIHFFFRMLEHPDNKRVNFWNSAVYMQKYNWQVLYNPLLTTVSFHVIDTMLEKCGIDLDFRGKAFERYIKAELTQVLVDRKYYFKMCPNNVTVKHNKGVMEMEIDLLLFLQDVVLLAEVKCIKYPMETRDKHNAERTLEGAASQVLKRKRFLESNYERIMEQHGVEARPREIVPIIITNYPMYTGTVREGIPVLDYSMLSHYFRQNELVARRVDGEKGEFREEVLHTTILYTNETEFCKSLFSYCYNNPIVNVYLARTDTAYYQVGDRQLLGKNLFRQYCVADFSAASMSGMFQVHGNNSATPSPSASTSPR